MTRLSTLFVAALALAACASETKTPAPSAPFDGSTRTLMDLNGSRVATPIGLFLASMDIDRDTRVSRTEVRDGAEESFKASDTNGDGYFRPIEFQDWSQIYLGSQHTNSGQVCFDADQDGRVSLSEFTAAFDQVQQRLDSNKDGTLVRAELLVEINGGGIDQEAIRAQIEAEIRQNMQGKMREVCQRSGRSR